MTPKRIALVGPVASGKSTLATAVAAHAGLPHLDLDALFWGPNWTPVPTSDFHARVRESLTADAWIADGNYGGEVAEMMVKRAELIIWLDLPLRVCLPRLVRRSIRRAATRQELFAGNRESFRHLVSRDSILRWGPAHHHRHRRRWAEQLSPDQADGPHVLHLDRPTTVTSQMQACGLLAGKDVIPR